MATVPRINLVAIAASLGGIEALSRILEDLPSDFPAPVLVVQHIGPELPSVLDQIIQYRSAMPVKWAEDGELVKPGTVYLAVRNRHLTIGANGSLFLRTSRPVNWVRPAADVLFESVAHHYGASSLAVVLTGRLYDGMAGAVHIKRSGGWVLAQDEESSRCFEMPRAAIRSGCVDFVLPLKALSYAICSLVMAIGATDLFRVPSKLAALGDSQLSHV